MLSALVVAATLGLSHGGDSHIVRTDHLSRNAAQAGAVVLARGGRERVDPFAEIKERRRQEAKEKREQEQHPPKKASQGQSN